MRLSVFSTGYESRGEDQECFHEADFSFHLNYTIKSWYMQASLRPMMVIKPNRYNEQVIRYS